MVAFGGLPVFPPPAALRRDIRLTAIAVEMPFANIPCRVAGRLEHLGKADFLIRQVEVVEEHPRGGRIAPRHQRGTIRGANRANRDGVSEIQAFLGKPVEIGGLDIRVACVPGCRSSPLIAKQVHNVRLGGFTLFRCGQGARDKTERSQEEITFNHFVLIVSVGICCSCSDVANGSQRPRSRILDRGSPRSAGTIPSAACGVQSRWGRIPDPTQDSSFRRDRPPCR